MTDITNLTSRTTNGRSAEVIEFMDTLDDNVHETLLVARSDQRHGLDEM